MEPARPARRHGRDGYRPGVPVSDLVRGRLPPDRRSGHRDALARAYNDWIADFCEAAPRRLFAAAMLPLAGHGPRRWRNCGGSPAIPCFRGAFIRPMFLEDHYFTEPLLRSAVGRAGTARAGRRSASDAGTVEPGMDLARTVLREDQADVSVKHRCRPAAAARSPAAAPACRALRSSPRSTSSAIRWRRSCPTGWTITCSSPRC